MSVVNVYATSATTENLSRHEMLMWVNDCLQSNFSRLEEMHTGAAYCQVSFFFHNCYIIYEFNLNLNIYYVSVSPISHFSSADFFSKFFF